MDAEGGWNTDRAFPEFEQEGPRYDDIYIRSGFATLQHAVDLALMQHLDPDQLRPHATLRAKSLPFPAYEDDPFFILIRAVFPLILVLAYIYTAMSLTR